MILRTLRGMSPDIAHSARLAENASVIGDVRLEAFVTVWYGAVLRGDAGPIRVGGGSNIQDNCVLHCELGQPLILGQNVVVGHGAILHGCTVEDGCLIGMGATLLDGCVIGEGSIVATGALVPRGKVIPPRSLVMGVPGKVVRPVTDQEAADTIANAQWYVEQGREELPALEKTEA